MKKRYLVANNQRRVLGIQDPTAVYRGEMPSEQGAPVVTPVSKEPAPAQQFTGTFTATQLNELSPWLLAVTLGSNGDVDLAAGSLACDVVKIHDSDDSHELSLVWNEAEASANRILNYLVHGGNRTIDLYENLKVLDGQDIELHASGGEKAQLAIDTQNAERTLDLSENLTVADGYNFTLQALGQANSLILNESLTIGGGNSGTITFSAASKVLTIDESETLSNYHTDARGDARYYTETELDAGQLDNRYYTETEFDTWASGVIQAEMDYLDGVTSDIQTQLDARCLESVFGTAIGTGLTLDGTTLKASSVLQTYHGINPSADIQSLLACANEAAIKTLLDLEIGVDILAQQTIGIADDNLVEIDHAAVADDDYAKFTASGLEGRSYAEVRSDLSSGNDIPSKTTAAWSKSIGSGGDYADWATMIAAMPDLIAHAVTVTIKSGTTLTEECSLQNKHAITNAGNITIRAEKYFPTSGAIPTADSATATTLRDAALATAALGDDYFNGCWVFVVDGTGTDNGFVVITDYVDATGDIVVTSWPGTQPDNTSRYIIVGALVDASLYSRGFYFLKNTASIIFKGIGVDGSDDDGCYFEECSIIEMYYCGVYDSDRAGIWVRRSFYAFIAYCGIVNNNTNNTLGYAGILSQVVYNRTHLCAISDNLQQGILSEFGGIFYSYQNFGDGNGAWGLYARYSGQAFIVAPECSGSSGNHSDEGTANTAGDDQAAAYT